MINQNVIRAAVDRLVNVAKPAKVILFGSYATGGSTTGRWSTMRSNPIFFLLLVAVTLTSWPLFMISIASLVKQMNRSVNGYTPTN